jgi:hypothetical protein
LRLIIFHFGFSAYSDIPPCHPPPNPIETLQSQKRPLRSTILTHYHHATRKIEPGTARDIMRSYGVTFEALDGEIPEPGDIPVPPAAPAVS